jgi:predicted DNA-binding protein
MAINKDTHVNASVVLPIPTNERVKNVAKKNSRSASAQMAYWIEKGLEDEENGVDRKTNASRKHSK